LQILFQLLSTLLDWSKAVPNARSRIIFAALCGSLAGLGNTVLIAVLSSVLVGRRTSQMKLAFIILCVAVPMGGLISQVLMIRLTSLASYELRMQLSKRILSTPYRLLESIGIPRLLAAITEDVSTVITAVSNLPTLITQLAIMSTCIVYLGWLSWRLLLLLLGCMGVGIAVYQFPMLKAMAHFEQIRESSHQMYKAIRGLTEGTKELKLNRDRREAFLAKEIEPSLDSIRINSNRGNTISSAASNAGQILFFVFLGLVIFLAPQLTKIDSRVLTGYTLTVLFMITPLTVILNLMPILGRANVAGRKIESLGLSLDSQRMETSTSSGQIDLARSPQIDLIGVSHVYRSDGAVEEFQLGPIDLSLLPGEVVFLVGGNGSGKTTLAKILVGLYEPEQGEVQFDHQTVGIENRDKYRQHFSVVFSDFYLFERLISLQGTDLDETSREYLLQLQLTHKVRVENGSLSTTELSQGQRKRLALLTAWLEDRPIYVFDEWASDQDPMFKEVFYRQIVPELKARGRTVVVITHDDRYFQLADRLIKLERGKIELDQRVTHMPLASAVSHFHPGSGI
jgi:putative pyoverdin transport system ATP-binding/permease protein